MEAHDGDADILPGLLILASLWGLRIATKLTLYTVCIYQLSHWQLLAGSSRLLQLVQLSVPHMRLQGTIRPCATVKCSTA